MGEGVTDTGVLHRIVCGVDGSAESLFAVRQAATAGIIDRILVGVRCA